MEHRFDAQAKALADSVSRREALARLGGGVAGLLLATFGSGRAWSQTGPPLPMRDVLQQPLRN
jgi:hypothetical protein